ncbi:hypothetical protein Hypma_016459 [Hypsizygus marmoreus]|uniref:Uncharacterized protein n=1 Tax=Hypsizygus marmoreus TaxID=39966 RepID=A0A369J5G4_HYPMA|nr:hypothetical protein Hypma_016459 [Hypsizygus marmoreus]
MRALEKVVATGSGTAGIVSSPGLGSWQILPLWAIKALTALLSEHAPAAIKGHDLKTLCLQDRY